MACSRTSVFAVVKIVVLLFITVIITLLPSAESNVVPFYDSTAYTKCKEQPEEPLYGGGVFNESSADQVQVGAAAAAFHRTMLALRFHSPSYALDHLTQYTKYSFSCWVKVIGDAESLLVRAKLSFQNSTFGDCIGSVVARNNCWSFLKGGFDTDSSSDSSAVLFLQSSGDSVVEIMAKSVSLQPFTDEQWRMQQEHRIRTKKKRTVNVHLSDAAGERVEGAVVTVQQISREFPFGSAIAKTILGNQAYQRWFVKRFNAAVFENELKWYATEREQGKLNYSLADALMRFVREKGILARGHNIFWEDPMYTPAWVRGLRSAEDLQRAVESRIESLMERYKEEFIHWDVSNEMLHFDFYESRLGPNATLHFFKVAKRQDPHAALFMNDFNVVETCADVNSTVDDYIARIQQLRLASGMDIGIGLEGHFSKPNIPLMRAVLDKLATLGLPIWLTEIDISNRFDQTTQSIYLEEVLREGFSHPWVNGIMVWAALHPSGECYQMCLTDSNFNNLPTGDILDQLLLHEWNTGLITGETDVHGSFIFDGFLGNYNLSINYKDHNIFESFSLCQNVDNETKQIYIHL